MSESVSGLKIIYFGTPGFSIPSLEKLLTAGYTVPAVVTVPDRPRGRGQQVIPSPIKKFAFEHRLPVLEPDDLRDPSFIKKLTDLQPDLMVVVAFRILPPEVFLIPRKGAFNLHASLLPRLRGAAPINWALINGETETGVTTFFLEQRVDTGNIILQARCSIGENETAGELHDRLAAIGAEIVLLTVRMIEKGNVHTTLQDESKASKAPKLTKETGRIEWSSEARAVHNLIRGLSPTPGAFTYHNDEVYKFFRSILISENYPARPGIILRADDELHVGTGRGIVKILELQREGKKHMDAAAFLRGTPLKVGDKFGNDTPE
jgi:methionyl-tRNA formyltransferase